MTQKVSVWHAFSTDVTGKALADTLGKTLSNAEVSAHGTWKGKEYDVLIGWGCKEPKDYEVKNTDLSKCKLVINRMQNVRLAADKFKALTKMKEDKVNVPTFVSSSQVMTALSNGTLKYPIYGRTAHHQAGGGLWECKMRLDVERAIKNGANYFVQFVPNVAEYRIHVMNGTVLQACKKAEQENPANAFKLLKTEEIENAAKKANKTVDKTTLDIAFEVFLKKDIQLPVDSIRHNDRGWKFVNVAADKCHNGVVTEALKAVKSLGLDFGAVDCIIGEDNKCYIIEVNTAPSLRESMLEKYASALKTMISTKLGAQTTKPVTVSKNTTTTTASEKNASSISKDEARKALAALGIDDATIKKFKTLFDAAS